MVDSQDNERDVSVQNNGGTFESAISVDSSDDEIEVWQPEPSRVTSSSPTRTKPKKRKLSDAGCIDLTQSDDETNAVKQAHHCTFHKGGQKFDIPIPLVRTKRVALKAVHSKQLIERERPEHLKCYIKSAPRFTHQQEDTSTTNVAHMPLKNGQLESDEEDEHVADRRQVPQFPSKTTGLDDHDQMASSPVSTTMSEDVLPKIQHSVAGPESIESVTELPKKQNGISSPVSKESVDVLPKTPTRQVSTEIPEDNHGDVCRRKRLSRNAKAGISSLNESILEGATSESAENETISCEEEDEEDEEDELSGFNVLTRIEHLTSTTLCGKTGLPVLMFSCYGGCDGMCYLHLDVLSK